MSLCVSVDLPHAASVPGLSRRPPLKPADTCTLRNSANLNSPGICFAGRARVLHLLTSSGLQMSCQASCARPCCQRFGSLQACLCMPPQLRMPTQPLAWPAATDGSLVLSRLFTWCASSLTAARHAHQKIPITIPRETDTNPNQQGHTCACAAWQPWVPAPQQAPQAQPLAQALQAGAGHVTRAPVHGPAGGASWSSCWHPPESAGVRSEAAGCPVMLADTYMGACGGPAAFPVWLSVEDDHVQTELYCQSSCA